MTTIPNNITVDHDEGRLTIDGVDFPFAIAEAPTCEPYADGGPDMVVVFLPVLAESFTVVGQPS